MSSRCDVILTEGSTAVQEKKLNTLLRDQTGDGNVYIHVPVDQL